MRVCNFDHRRHSGEFVLGIEKEGDYVTTPIQKSSIGPYYLPNRAQTPQPAIQCLSQSGPNLLSKKILLKVCYVFLAQWGGRRGRCLRPENCPQDSYSQTR